jgi:hypothetical protein
VGTTPLSQAQILRSIEDFLDQESSPPKPQQCRHCGSPMQFVDVRFLLCGTTMHRGVSLPICPVCEREILKNLPRPESIH